VQKTSVLLGVTSVLNTCWMSVGSWSVATALLRTCEDLSGGGMAGAARLGAWAMKWPRAWAISVGDPIEIRRYDTDGGGVKPPPYPLSYHDNLLVSLHIS